MEQDLRNQNFLKTFWNFFANSDPDPWTNVFSPTYWTKILIIICQNTFWKKWETNTNNLIQQTKSNKKKKINTDPDLYYLPYCYSEKKANLEIFILKIITFYIPYIQIFLTQSLQILQYIFYYYYTTLGLSYCMFFN